MVARFAALILAFCGFAASEAAAALVEDRLQSVMDGGVMQLQTTGPAVLQGVLLKEDAARWLEKKRDQPVLVRKTGADRYGRTLVVVVESRKRNAPSWQEMLLQQKLAMIYDRAATPQKWLKAEQPMPTITPEQASTHIGEFVLVKGVVTRSFKSRDTYYINFGEDWKTDFSLRIPRRAWRAFGEDFSIADGTTIYARGAVFLANGPMIELTRPEQLQEPGKVMVKKRPAKKVTPPKTLPQSSSHRRVAASHIAR